MSARPALEIIRLHFSTLASTNSHARELAARGSLAPGALSVVTADEQTGGRGRLGRVWQSGRDDVKATFAFRVPPHALATAYQLSPLMAVAAARVVARRAAVMEAAAAGALELPRVQIKWPNDLVVRSCRKAGGILCELESARDGSHWAALGIGLNVNSLPDELNVERAVWPLTTLRAESAGAAWDVAGIVDDLCAELSRVLAVFFGEGFAPFQSEYEAESVLLGKVVRFTDVDGAQPVQGRAVRIGADGRLFLLVADDSSPGAAQERGFLSGEVSGVEIVDDDGVARLLQGEKH